MQGEIYVLCGIIPKHKRPVHSREIRPWQAVGQPLRRCVGARLAPEYSIVSNKLWPAARSRKMTSHKLQ